MFTSNLKFITIEVLSFVMNITMVAGIVTVLVMS